MGTRVTRVAHYMRPLSSRKMFRTVQAIDLQGDTSTDGGRSCNGSFEDSMGVYQAVIPGIDGGASEFL
jgi:hypothetical protein